MIKIPYYGGLKNGETLPLFSFAMLLIVVKKI